jgi:signal peptidase I
MLDLIAAVFDWSGGATRRKFWSMAALTSFLVLGVAGLEFALSQEVAFHRLSFALAGLLLPVMMSLAVRRLHDAGYSGLWCFLLCVPFGALVLIWLWAKPSSRTQRGQFTWKSRHAWGVGFVCCMSLLLILRGFYQPFWIPSGSMKPALFAGDYILAAPIPNYEPQRGDVVVFKHPVAGGDYVKRLIGLPGDRLQMRDGRVILNGDPLVQSPMPDLTELKSEAGPGKSLPRCANDPVGIGGTCSKHQAMEALSSGRAYRVLDIEPNAFADNTHEVIVPEGQYYFLGDNRDNSLDSRYSTAVGGLGFVPASHIIGPVRWVVFSAGGASLAAFWAWRPDRFLKVVE